MGVRVPPALDEVKAEHENPQRNSHRPGLGAVTVGYVPGVLDGAHRAWRSCCAIAATFKFVSEVKVELDKCSWPWDPNQTGFKRYKELIESTVVVIISVILLAGFVTTSDLVLAHVVGFLTGGGITK